MKKPLIYLAIKDELEQIQENYDYDPCIEERDNNIISWEDYEGDRAFIQVIDDNTITFWTEDIEPNVTTKIISYQDFLIILHGDEGKFPTDGEDPYNNNPLYTIPSPNIEKTGYELMSEIYHTSQFLTNMGYDITHTSIDDIINTKVTIISTLSELRLRATEPIKDPFQ